MTTRSKVARRNPARSAQSLDSGVVHSYSVATSRSNAAFQTGRGMPSSQWLHSDSDHEHRLIQIPSPNVAKIPLRVMKFGGTSVGDSSSIRKCLAAIHAGRLQSRVAIVVSAMSGVTSQLVESASRSEAGNYREAAAIFEKLFLRHDAAARELISTPTALRRFRKRIRAILHEGKRFCRAAHRARKLTPEMCDAISGIGERLSVYLVAAALAETGVFCEPMEATDLVVTDDRHGSAEPILDLTRERCRKSIWPLLRRGIVPIITGFIGATEDGKLTTLGRNSSDYSATILGAALDAEEVVIWTDVDGVLTADPRLVPGARRIAEISFHEAAEMANCGAKVLHTKCLRPLLPAGIPLRICNTFAPERPGTRIVPGTYSHAGEVKALAAADGLGLVRMNGFAEALITDLHARSILALENSGADIRLICRADSNDGLAFVVPSAAAETAVKSLRREFFGRLRKETKSRIAVQTPVSVVTAVGHNVCGNSEFLEATFDALARRKIRVLGVSREYSDTSFSFVVESGDMRAALAAAHQELCCHAAEPLDLSVGNV